MPAPDPFLIFTRKLNELKSLRFPPAWICCFLLSGQYSHAEKPWRAVTGTGIEEVKVRAEQATLNTDGFGHIQYYGYGGPRNLHTRKLCFTCKGASYLVPQDFVDDLLDLHIIHKGPIYTLFRASINGKDIVFSLEGSDGEKGYFVHFHYKGGHLFQRILVYGEDRAIYIRAASQK